MYGRAHRAVAAVAECAPAVAGARQRRPRRRADAELPERATALDPRESSARAARGRARARARARSPTAAASSSARSSGSPGMSAARAKQLLLQEIEDQAKHDAARRIRQIEEETKREAERRVRNILSVCMQRLAAGHAAETTVSVVQLASDDMKGRIIGREGRNIRALENLTGVDFIIDDTPGRGRPVGLRRRPPRDRAADAREAAPGRPDPSGPDRGDVLPGEVRARGAHRRDRRAGRVRRRRPGRCTRS